MEPAALLAELLRDGVDERGGVVVQRGFDLGDALRRGRLRVLLERLGRIGRHHSELGPGGRGGELDVQPGPEPTLVRPDSGHGGTGVTGDH